MNSFITIQGLKKYLFGIRRKHFFYIYHNQLGRWWMHILHLLSELIFIIPPRAWVMGILGKTLLPNFFVWNYLLWRGPSRVGFQSISDLSLEQVWVSCFLGQVYVSIFFAADLGFYLFGSVSLVIFVRSLCLVLYDV